MGTSRNKSVRILVVDRDPALVAQIRNTLSHEGYELDTATSAARGLTLARNGMPALMIIGTELEDCNGFELAQSVCLEYAAHEIPMIFVSAGQDPEAIAAARAAGGVYCLSKPIDDLVLLDLVEQALWMPHLVRRHLDVHGHGKHLKAPRVLTREAHRSTVHF